MESLESVVQSVFDECYSSEKDRKQLTYLLSAPDKALKYSLEFFHNGELPEKVIHIHFDYDPPNSTEGFLWSTNNRVFFASNIGGFLQSPKPLYKEFAYGSIATIQVEKGGFFSSDKIIFHLSTNSSTGYVAKVIFVSTANYERLEEFAGYVRRKIANFNTAVSYDSQASVAPDGEDLVDRLERLGKLKTQGIITDEEFIAAKKKLLDM